MRSFTVSITREGRFFIARCPEMNVTSQGKSLEEAQTNIKEALECAVESFGIADIPETPLKPLWTTVEIG